MMVLEALKGSALLFGFCNVLFILTENFHFVEIAHRVLSIATNKESSPKGLQLDQKGLNINQ
jgi:hypothetical protein